LKWEGPEIEDDYHNFGALNIPAQPEQIVCHPAGKITAPMDLKGLSKPLNHGGMINYILGKAPGVFTSLFLAGVAVTSTANEINYLDGATVINGGLVFGNGTYLTQDASSLFFDTGTSRLGIGRSDPTVALDVADTGEPGVSEGKARVEVESDSVIV